MKKKIIIIVLSLIIFCLISIIIFSLFGVRSFNTKSFKINYDYKWNLLKKDNNELKLSNKNNSTIEVFTQKLDNNQDSIEDIYYNINNDFLKSNKSYELINNSATTIGKLYYNGYELLYENENNQLLYIIIVDKDKIIHINYLAKTKYFDSDLDYFYEVINTLEIR